MRIAQASGETPQVAHCRPRRRIQIHRVETVRPMTSVAVGLRRPSGSKTAGTNPIAALRRMARPGIPVSAECACCAAARLPGSGGGTIEVCPLPSTAFALRDIWTKSRSPNLGLRAAYHKLLYLLGRHDIVSFVAQRYHP